VLPPPALALGRRHAGLTLIELVVVICIIGVVAALLLDRLRFYQEAAEKAAMESTLGALKSALQLRIAAMLVNGEEAKIESLARANPSAWLSEPPRGYRGEFRADQPVMPRGSWYFDATRGELVYLPDLADHLKIGGAGGKSLRFRVQIEFEPSGRDSAGHRQAFRGMRIVPVTEYAWF